MLQDMCRKLRTKIERENHELKEEIIFMLDEPCRMRIHMHMWG